MHNLHTFEHRLICLYTWRQQARGKNKKIGRKRATVAPYFEKIRRKCTISARYPAASSPRRSFASTSSPSPSLMERGPGGEARDNQEYQALYCNLLMHLATGIMTSINNMQKSRIDEKTQLAASNSRSLAALTPLVTRDKRGWVLSCIMAAYRPRQGRSRQDLAVRV